MELLLPVAIKLFPNMLPSTFEDKFAAVSHHSFIVLHFRALKPSVGREAEKASARSPGDGEVPSGDSPRKWY